MISRNPSLFHVHTYKKKYWIENKMNKYAILQKKQKYNIGYILYYNIFKRYYLYNKVVDVYKAHIYIIKGYTCDLNLRLGFLFLIFINSYFPHFLCILLHFHITTINLKLLFHQDVFLHYYIIECTREPYSEWRSPYSYVHVLIFPFI